MSQIRNQKSINTAYVVTRVIRLKQLNVTAASLLDIENLLANKATLAFNPVSGKLSITYDSATVSFGLIMSELRKAGIALPATFWFRLKYAVFEFADGNSASQAAERPKPCCNRVPKM